MSDPASSQLENAPECLFLKKTPTYGPNIDRVGKDQCQTLTNVFVARLLPLSVFAIVRQASIPINNLTSRYCSHKAAPKIIRFDHCRTWHAGTGNTADNISAVRTIERSLVVFAYFAHVLQRVWN